MRYFHPRPLLLAAAIVPVASVATSFATPPSSAYKLVFADDFNTTTLDNNKWGYNYPWGAHEHTSQAYMDQSQVLLTGTALNLQAIAVRNPNATDFNDPNFGWQVANYTSGCINTSGKFNATRGYFEASIKMPQVTGTWPAFWMLQGGWPPEVDIVEYLNAGAGSTGNKQDHVTYHYTNTSGSASSYGNTYSAPADLATGYHTYGFEWTSTVMNFYLDGTIIRTVTDTNAIAQASGMYMLLENQVGGWAGTPAGNSAFPADMLVDYVRVYQSNTVSGTTTTWGTAAGSGSWDTAASWSAQTPKFQDLTPVFGTNNNAAVNLTWSNGRMVGGLTFSGTNTAYTLGTVAGTLSLSNSGGNAAVTVNTTVTAPQTVAANVDLYTSATLTNNSAASITFSGVISGPGALTIEGTGTTVLANNNTYEGATYIDGGAQGPAVVRVTRSRPFGTVGTVIFNTAGNATSGRVEIQDGREIPNNIQLSGRNNTGVALENISGSNIFSGTLSLLAGGGNYLLQSDAGLMSLTATSANTTNNATPGVSLTSLASGNRTVTLQGAALGLVSGRITDGAAVLGLIKAGPGTWTLSGSNSYSGPITVTGGTLKAGNTYAFGSTTGTTTVTATGTLDLNGQYVVETIASITGSGTDGTGALVNNSTQAATLTGTITATSAFSLGGSGNLLVGRIAAPGQTITKAGTGATTVTGPFTAANLIISSGTFALSTPTSGGTPSVAATLASVSVAANATLAITATPRLYSVGQHVLVTNTLDLSANTGILDLANNDLVIRTSDESSVRAMITAWYHGGARDGRGLGSSLAGTGADVDVFATLAVAPNTNGQGGPLYTTFDTVPVVTTDFLVKYTYAGDANLDGTVDATDLALYLAGQAGNLTGWLNGDFNYDGQVNAADLVLLLNSLQNQGTPFGDGAPGGSGAVPEPHALLALPITLLLSRRRR